MDERSFTEVNTVNQDENRSRLECASNEDVVYQPGCHIQPLNPTDHEPALAVTLSEFSGSDTADSRNNSHDGCCNGEDGSNSETQLSTSSLPYYTSSAGVCHTADCLEVIAGDCGSVSPGPDGSPDSANDTDFFSPTGSDRGRDHGSDLSLESFYRLSTLKFLRRFSRQRSSSVPPCGSDHSETTLQVCFLKILNLCLSFVLTYKSVDNCCVKKVKARSRLPNVGFWS